MKTFVITLLAIFSATFAEAQDPFLLWKVTISLPVQYLGQTAAHKPAILTRTLKNNDIINLIMGRPLTTKIVAKDEALAVAGDDGTPGTGSEIIVVNPTSRTKLATVWTLPTFQLLFANPPDDSVAVGYATVDVQATTAGTPALNGFDATTISAAGSAKVSASGGLAITNFSICGPIKFHITGSDNQTVSYDGLLTKGSFATGASLGVLQ